MLDYTKDSAGRAGKNECKSIADYFGSYSTLESAGKKTADWMREAKGARERRLKEWKKGRSGAFFQGADDRTANGGCSQIIIQNVGPYSHTACQMGKAGSKRTFREKTNGNLLTLGAKPSNSRPRIKLMKVPIYNPTTHTFSEPKAGKAKRDKNFTIPTSKGMQNLQKKRQQKWTPFWPDGPKGCGATRPTGDSAYWDAVGRSAGEPDVRGEQCVGGMDRGKRTTYEASKGTSTVGKHVTGDVPLVDTYAKKRAQVAEREARRPGADVNPLTGVYKSPVKERAAKKKARAALQLKATDYDARVEVDTTSVGSHISPRAGYAGRGGHRVLTVSATQSASAKLPIAPTPPRRRTHDIPTVAQPPPKPIRPRNQLTSLG